MMDSSRESSRLCLVSSPAAAEVEYRSRREGILFRYQPGNHSADFIDFKKTAAWNLAQHVVHMFLGHLIENPRTRCCWSDAVHGDIVLRCLLPQRLSQGNHAGFRSAVRRSIRIALFAGNRSNVD